MLLKLALTLSLLTSPVLSSTPIETAISDTSTSVNEATQITTPTNVAPGQCRYQFGIWFVKGLDGVWRAKQGQGSICNKCIKAGNTYACPFEDKKLDY